MGKIIAARVSGRQEAVTKAKGNRKKRAPLSTHAKTLKAREKLAREFGRNRLTLHGIPLQALQLLDYYAKYHILDAEPVLFREILRTVHRMLPKSPQKSKLRGILGKILIIKKKKKRAKMK